MTAPESPPVHTLSLEAIQIRERVRGDLFGASPPPAHTLPLEAIQIRERVRDELFGTTPPPTDTLPLEGAQIRERVRDELFGSNRDTQRYKILRKLGAGGQGVVYAAYDPILDCEVALKQFHARPGRSNQLIDRLRQEARLLAKLRGQPHVVTLYDFFMQDDQVFVVMELVPGSSLRRWQATPHTWPEILAVYLQAGRGLAAAHDASVIHRDFKPDNVLLDDAGVAKVADFGIADVPGVTLPAIELPAARSGGSTSLEHAGTHRYMAPEHHDHGHTTAASDQYSFCVALYEALYGQHPTMSPGSSIPAPGARHRGDVHTPKGTRVPRHIYRVLRRGLEVAPANRYPSMQALLTDLAARPGRRNAVIAAGVLALAAAITWFSIPPPTLADHVATARATLDEPLRLAEVRTNLAAHMPQDAAQRLATGIDEIATRWADATGSIQFEIASDTDDDGRARLHCLDLARDDLTTFTTTLRTASTIDLAGAADSLDALSEPHDCLTLQSAPLRCRVDEASERREPTAEPVLRALAAAEAHEIAGALSSAIDAAAEAARLADAQTDAPLLQARAHYAHGRLAQLAERPAQALAALDQVRRRIEARECLDMRTDTFGRMVKIAAQNPSVPLAPALDWSNVQQNLAAQLKDPRRIAQAHSDRGLLSVLRGAEPELQHEDPAVALRELTTARELRETSLDGQPTAEQADTLLNLSTLHRTRTATTDKSAELAEARRNIEAAIDQRSRVYGSDHPALYRDLQARALLESDEGHPEIALATLEHALALAKRGYGEASGPTLKLLNTRMRIEYSLERLPAATATAEQIAALAASAQMDPIVRYKLLSACASLFASQNKIPQTTRLLDVLQKNPPTRRLLLDHPIVAYGFAEANANAEHHEYAESMATTALIGFEAKAATPPDPYIAKTLLLRAWQRYALQRFDDALGDLVRLTMMPGVQRSEICELYDELAPDIRPDPTRTARFSETCR